MKALQDYFGDYKDPKWNQVEFYKQEIQRLSDENEGLKGKMTTIRDEIEREKEAKIQREKEEELRKEQEATKGRKPAGRRN